MNNTLLSLKNVSKIFNDKLILDTINLDVFDGEFLTLLGPSGCGKTTILRLIGGFEEPSSGEIVLNGLPINDLVPEKRATNTVFQSYALFPHMSVYDNIAFGLKMKKESKAQIEQKVMQSLEMVKLLEHKYKNPMSLAVVSNNVWLLHAPLSTNL